MLQSFIIMCREGLESFLIVAVTLAYLKKTGGARLVSSVYAGVVAAIALSIGLGFALAKVANQSLWEGGLGVVAVVMVASLVIHMWRVGPQFKKQMENQLADISARSATRSAAVGVFFFTVFMICREGMETSLMLFQVKNQPFIVGGLIGLAAAAGMGYLWIKFSHLVNMRNFFRVTGVYLLIFMLQTALYAFHELCEAGVLPQSDRWHAATEPYSPDGVYGKWFSFVTLMVMGGWLVVTAIRDSRRRHIRKVAGAASLENQPAPAFSSK